MIILIDFMILSSLIFVELMIIKQIWMVNLESQRIKIVRVEDRVVPITVDSETAPVSDRRGVCERIKVDRYVFRDE